MSATGAKIFRLPVLLMMVVIGVFELWGYGAFYAMCNHYGDSIAVVISVCIRLTKSHSTIRHIFLYAIERRCYVWYCTSGALKWIKKVSTSKQTTYH